MLVIELNEISEDLYARIKKSAKMHHRTINSEILYCLSMQFQNTVEYPYVFDNQSAKNILSKDELKALFECARP